MEKIKHSFADKLRNVLITLLTLTMLLLAVLYIGGSQFAADSSALRTDGLSAGALTVGENATLAKAVYEKELLPVSFAGIRFSGVGGGIYGGEKAATALAEFAAEPIHLCLGAGSVLSEVSAAEFTAAMTGNYLFLDLLTALPYQMIYILTGEYDSVAASDAAIRADRLLMAFAADSRIALYLSNGRKYYRSEREYPYKASEIATLAKDSRLADFKLAPNGVAQCTGSPHAPSLSLSNGGNLTPEQYAAVHTLFGFRPTAGNIEVQSLVDPHGTLQLAKSRLSFTASSDGGISVSSLLDTAKDTLDIDTYDILIAGLSFVEQIREILPTATGGTLSPYLKSFSRDEDTYTVVFGLQTNSIAVAGDAYPYFAKFTVQNGFFQTIDLRLLTATASSYTRTLFPSGWHYAHAAETAVPRTLRLQYRAETLPEENLDAVWYYTDTKEVAE